MVEKAQLISTVPKADISCANNSLLSVADASLFTSFSIFPVTCLRLIKRSAETFGTLENISRMGNKINFFLALGTPKYFS